MTSTYPGRSWHLKEAAAQIAKFKLFNDRGPRFANRNGGYLRILKFGFRQGDNAPMTLVELLDRPDAAEETKAAGK